ncbi:MAG: hypothetical protein KC910_16310 [Candidatus Eremiobacteraeota bacterium]|nr:hypothetical protein [Candidatus Eremiobacteraeota bacterium]
MLTRQVTPALPSPSGSVSDAYEVLGYNQQLVEFADSKAGNLILINSLFIAAAQAMPASGSLLKLLQVGSVLASAVAVLLCLNVIMSKGGGLLKGLGLDDCLPHQPQEADFVFFADILRRRDAREYAAAFAAASPATHLQTVLSRTYVVAEIAARKFRSYGPAQTLTTFSAVIWVVANALSVLG